MTEYNGNTRNSQSKNFSAPTHIYDMDPAKIALLASFADELMKTPDNRKMQAFLSLNQKMRESSIFFSGNEQELLFEVLTESLSPAERQKAEMIRRLAGRLQNPP